MVVTSNFQVCGTGTENARRANSLRVLGAVSSEQKPYSNTRSDLDSSHTPSYNIFVFLYTYEHVKMFFTSGSRYFTLNKKILQNFAIKIF